MVTSCDATRFFGLYLFSCGTFTYMKGNAETKNYKGREKADLVPFKGFGYSRLLFFNDM